MSHDHHNGHDGHDMDYDDVDHAGKSHDNGHGSGHGSHGSSHAMVFHMGNHATILFSSWMTSTMGEMFGSCMAVLVIAALYEGLKMLRERLLMKSQEKQKRLLCSAVPTDDNQVATVDRSPSCCSQMLNIAHFIQTLLHMLQVGISYMLMLVFMTYNVWLCLAVVAGAGIGYFLFGWKRRQVVDLNEHCH